jgi:hypothetical protein
MDERVPDSGGGANEAEDKRAEPPDETHVCSPFPALAHKPRLAPAEPT